MCGPDGRDPAERSVEPIELPVERVAARRSVQVNNRGADASRRWNAGLLLIGSLDRRRFCIPTGSRGASAGGPPYTACRCCGAGSRERRWSSGRDAMESSGCRRDVRFRRRSGHCGDRVRFFGQRNAVGAVRGPGALADAVVYRSPTCGCCKSYEEYLRRHGSRVTSEVTEDMEAVRSQHRIPVDAQSCHTTVIGDYAIEGHVPVEAIEKLLAERPDIDGIAVPGMPTNAPGMGEPNGEPIEVLSLDDGQVALLTRI